jgi:NAD(P)-dependent dehydrogenase (short-subunit alcohol dehydrogenase family)
MGNISGKVAIVTGAGRGIGRAIALTFAHAGAKVVVASRTQATVDRLVGEIQKSGGAAIGLTCDVGQRDQVFALAERAHQEFGALDILVNNAQAHGPASTPSNTWNLQPLETFDEDDWEHTYRTGLLATLWGMKAVFPYMKNQGGKIINMSSMAGQVGNAGSAAYNATKEGIRALTRTGAREWGKYHINVNVISPSVRTDGLDEFERQNPAFVEAALQQVPLGRFGDPMKDVGPLALFLGSSDSDYITGMTFMLDGGLFMYP